MTAVRPILARVLLGALIAAALTANYRFYSFRTAREPRDRDAAHRQPRQFVERIAQTTELGTAVAFEVPAEFSDEGYVPRRFQYLLPGRHVVSPLASSPERPDYLARWRIDTPLGHSWRLVWRDARGSLWTRVR